LLPADNFLGPKRFQTHPKSPEHRTILGFYKKLPRGGVEKETNIDYNNTMKAKVTEIDKIHDKIFKKIFGSVQNTKDFLKKILPTEIKTRLDFKTIKIDNTYYVSNEFKEGYSDIVVKAKMNSVTGEKINSNIYFLLEHKSEGNVKIFFQMLKYMVFVWEKDINAHKPLRVIIPIVFYHGKEKWGVPASFAGQFKVEEEMKKFLLDFSYILFDTNAWDFRDESNREFKDNVFLFTTLSLMKAAFKNDLETIRDIFDFWREKGFIENKEMVLFYLKYITTTQNLDPIKLKKMMIESKIDGGEVMQTLAQRWMKEGEKKAEQIWKPKWIKSGERKAEKKFKAEKIEAEKKLIAEKIAEKREMAKRMLLKNYPLEEVSTITGLTEQEIHSMVN